MPGRVPFRLRATKPAVLFCSLPLLALLSLPSMSDSKDWRFVIQLFLLSKKVRGAERDKVNSGRLEIEFRLSVIDFSVGSCGGDVGAKPALTIVIAFSDYDFV